MSKAVPDGLKPQECERGSGRVKPPIPYIPEKDDLQEAVESTATIKLTLPTKVELRVSVWSRGTPEKFLVHVQQAIAAIKAKGLQEAYERLVRAEKECTEKLEEAVLSRDLTEGEVRDDSALSKAIDKATEAQTKAKSAVEQVANQIFQLYSNFLSEEARQPWSKILAEQIDCSPWKDLRGNVHNTPRNKTWASFMECVTFHLLTVFRNDAAEAQRYYISNGLKKPNRQFVQRVQQLNDYLELLPCLYQSNRATPATKKVGPIDDADLAGHILCMCPGTWQAQYELKAETVPQCVRDLLDDLEKIEKAFPTERDQSAKKGKLNPSESNKRKMVSLNEPIPKKVRKMARHCALCKKHGAHATHNTSDCRKYEKDGKPKTGFGKGKHGSTALDKKTASAFAQLSAKVEKLEKANKRLKKSSKKRKRDYDSDSSDSDST
eukprot:CCRYP_009841-RA/>CCRYP_009841-RA protein AED:0.19 eAED:0.61 QI:0/0/0/1/1/1/2/0/435